MIRSLPLVSLILCVSAASAGEHSLFAPLGAIAERAAALAKIEAFARAAWSPALEGRTRELELKRIEQGFGVRTTQTALRLDGVPVFGAGVSHHVSAHGESFTADLPLVAPAQTAPRVDARTALAIASLRSANPLANAPELRLLPSADRTRTDLVWWIDFRSVDAGSPGATVVVDALTGRVLADLSKLHTARAETEVYNAHEGGLAIKVRFSEEMEARLSRKQAARIRPSRRDPEIVGCTLYDLDLAEKNGTRVEATAKDIEVSECEAIVTGEDPRGAEACQIVNAIDGSLFRIVPENCELFSVDTKIVGSKDRSADVATDNARMVFEYFSHRFGRNSFDGRGTTLRSVVKAGFGWSNAAWLSDLNFMMYGAGDGEEMGDFTQLIDVAGHEMTHGVVRATANLEMMDEPGALNEATADFFGLQMAQYNDWEIGVGLYLKRPKDGLRSLSNPGKYSDTYVDDTGAKVKKPNPARYSDRYRTRAECGQDNDRCFVHMNSTIMGHGYFQIRSRLGKGKAQDLIFLALTQYYRENTNFREAGQLLRQACKDLMGRTAEQSSRQIGQRDCDLVDEALRVVEL